MTGEKEKMYKVIGNNKIKVNTIQIPSCEYYEIILKEKEIKELLGKRISVKKLLQKTSMNLPKYIYPLIDKANYISGGSRAYNVGKLHVLIKKCKFNSLNQWKTWYNKKYPNAINIATHKISKTVEQFIINITHKKRISTKEKRNIKKYSKRFIENLIFDKTFAGMKIQEVILKKLSIMMKVQSTWATASDDSKGIDGYLGSIPVSIKPITCNIKKKPGVKRINYTIKNNEIMFTFSS
ncbi:MAG: MjaI family restriction endonuclease [archaeon]